MSGDAKVAMLSGLVAGLTTLGASLLTQVISAFATSRQRVAEFKAQAQQREQEVRIRREEAVFEVRRTMLNEVRDATASLLAVNRMMLVHLDERPTTYTEAIMNAWEAKERALLAEHDAVFQRTLRAVFQVSDDDVGISVSDLMDLMADIQAEGTSAYADGINDKVREARRKFVHAVENALTRAVPPVPTAKP